MNRRSALAGAAALLACSRAARAADVDVAIVGAGAAGLAAAKRLRALGRSVILVEARDRIGGRIVTDRRLGLPFDAGAEYIHFAERNPWAKIASEFGLQPSQEEGGNPLRIYANGVILSDSDRGRRRRAFAQAEEMVRTAILPDRSIAATVAAAGPDVSDAALGITRLILGEESDRVSAADYSQLWNGSDLLVPTGYGSLVERFGQDLPVRLRSPVRRIVWAGPGVQLDAEGGTIRARAAIVTVPVNVIKAGGIAFSPELPAPTQDALSGLRMGAYTKIALRVDRARLDAATLSDAIDLESTRATTSFEAFPFGRDLILAYLGGDYARDLCRAGEAAAVEHAKERLAAVTEPAVVRAVTAGVLADWWTDPFSQGSYSIAIPGALGARDALRRPLADRVWFAGEASAGGGAMTGGGAFLEGERAAEEASRALGT